MGPGDPFRVTGRLGLLELVLSPPFGEELIDEGAIGSNIPPHPPKLAHERGPRGHDEPVLLDLHRSGILPATAELIIDAEEDPALRAVVVGVLRGAGAGHA